MASKYHSKKTKVNNLVFDSRKEAERYIVLKAMERSGMIRDLKRQVRYDLIPSQRIDGKVVERGVSYIADFVYHDKDGNLIVEDTKGFKTPEYILKRKLMLWFFGIRISEV